MIGTLTEDFTIETTRVMELLNTTGKRVYRLRKDKGWNQANLAQKANIRQNYISAIENDTAAPSADTMTAIAKALDTTLDFLMLLTSNPALPGDSEPTFLTEEAERAAKVIDSLPKSERAKLLTQVVAYEQDYFNFLAHKRKLEQILESVERRWGDEAKRVVLDYAKVMGQALLNNREGGEDQLWDLLDDATQ